MEARVLTPEEVQKLRKKHGIQKVPGYKTAAKVLNKVGEKLQTDEAKKRFEICQQCDRFNSETETCSECGCAMKFKTVLHSQSCPIGKW